MKIAYIGTNDVLAETLARRMGQEGHDVYLLSDEKFLRKMDASFRHRFYRIPRRGESFQKLLGSVVPDCIIFAGNDYAGSGNEDKSDEDMALLSRSLQTARALPDVRFILLSGTQVCETERGGGKSPGRAGNPVSSGRAAVKDLP